MDLDFQIKKIIAETLDIDVGLLDDRSGPRAIQEWKGPVHMEIVKKLEQHFNLKFEPTEIETFINIRIIRATIMSNLDMTD